MNIHCCTVCSLNFSTKSNLNKHQKKYHEINEEKPIKKNDITLQLRIIELENQLKLKDMELKIKDVEIENLKLQPKIKNQTDKTPQKIIEIDQPSQFNLNIFLNETCKDAYNFDEIFNTFIFNADYNSWLLNVDNGKEEFNLLKNLNISSYSRGSNFYVDFFCEPFNKIEHTKKPIYCSDYKRNIYYIKNNSEWEKISYSELINKIYQKIFKKPLIYLNYIFSHTLKKINEKQFYQIYPTITDFNSIKQTQYDKLILNFCDATQEKFLHKCNIALKKITTKNQLTYIPSALNANDNDFFKDEPDEQNYSEEEEE